MAAGRIVSTRRRWPCRSARLPRTLETYPGKTETELVTFASTEGRPVAISVGNVISEPPPARALIAPARMPAAISRRMCPRSIGTLNLRAA
jgi:hypothetical protein